MNRTVDTFIALLRSAVTETHEMIDLTAVDYEALYGLSKHHDLAHVVFFELKQRGALQESEVFRKFQKQYDLALCRHVIREIAFDRVRKALEEAQIPFVLLKGAYLMSMYPEPWMRTSSDIDVLVNACFRSKAIKALKTAGFVMKAESSHDVAFFTQEKYHVELHFLLIEDGRLPNVSCVLERIWDYTACCDNRFERVLFDEMLYFYHIAHMAKHFKQGGCGIKSFVDLWLLNHKKSFDVEKREKLLDESGIATFARRCEKQSEKWFSREENKEFDDFEDYIIRGGVYGTADQNIAVRSKKSKNRFSYYFRRVFLPYNDMKYTYLVLNKFPLFLPFFWIVRWLRILKPGVRKKAINEICIERSMDDEQRERVEYLIKSMEIW